MVQIESLQTQPPSQFEFLEYLKFEYLEFENRYWPTLLAEYGYAPTLTGLETLLAEQYILFEYNDICDEQSTDILGCTDDQYVFCLYGNVYGSNNTGMWYDIDFCFESILAGLTLLAEYNYEPTLADLETDPYLLEWFERFQSEEFRKKNFKEYFNDDWRSGQEVHKVVITQRFYQTSPNSTQA